MTGWLEDLYRKTVFFIGDIRKIDCFPWITWDVHQHAVGMEEVIEALHLIKYGDIGVHRDAGYLSNIAIPGFFKHAWIHTEDGVDSPMIVEAVSEGVIHRSAAYPLYSDYAMILRPKGIGYKARRGACKKAKSIVGTRYDHDFNFDIEEELKHYNGDNGSVAANELGQGAKYMKKFDHGFSCTEVVSYAWWHCREQLRIFREKSRGKRVILADSFVNRGWEIVWASKSVTVEAAIKWGLHEEGVDMIREFRS